MPVRRWADFFLYLLRILFFLVLLAVFLPKLAAVCNIWLSSHLKDEEKPHGNPLRVEAPEWEWSEFVIQLFPGLPEE